MHTLENIKHPLKCDALNEFPRGQIYLSRRGARFRMGEKVEAAAAAPLNLIKSAEVPTENLQFTRFHRGCCAGSIVCIGVIIIMLNEEAIEEPALFVTSTINACAQSG